MPAAHPLQVYLLVALMQSSAEGYSAVHPFAAPVFVRAGHHITPLYTDTPHHITPHRTTSHHTAPHHTAPHHTTPLPSPLLFYLPLPFFRSLPPSLPLPSPPPSLSLQLVGYLLVRVASPFQRAIQCHVLQLFGRVGVEVSPLSQPACLSVSSSQ